MSPGVDGADGAYDPPFDTASSSALMSRKRIVLTRFSPRSNAYSMPYASRRSITIARSLPDRALAPLAIGHWTFDGHSGAHMRVSSPPITVMGKRKNLRRRGGRRKRRSFKWDWDGGDTVISLEPAGDGRSPLVDAVSAAIRNQDRVRRENLPRRADAALFFRAAERMLPGPAVTFGRVLEEDRRDSIALSLESNAIALTVRRLMYERAEWKRTATNLLESQCLQ